MPRLNPAYNSFRYRPFSVEVYTRHEQREALLSSTWRRLNSSNFRDHQARETLLWLADPFSHPHGGANRTIITIKKMNELTDWGVHDHNNNDERFRLMEYGVDFLSEMVMHRAAFSASFHDLQYLRYGGAMYFPQNVMDILYAIERNQYHKNHDWMNSVHSFTREWMKEVARRLAGQALAARAGGDLYARKLTESALIALTFTRSRGTLDEVSAILYQADHELAESIKWERGKLSADYAYHQTSSGLLGLIAEKGFSAQFAPAGCEQPDALCFWGSWFIDDVNLDYYHNSSPYSKFDILLRVKLSDGPFVPGYRPPFGSGGELQDFTADYLLYRQHVIPPEKVEMVDPVIAAWGYPLVI